MVGDVLDGQLCDIKVRNIIGKDSLSKKSIS